MDLQKQEMNLLVSFRYERRLTNSFLGVLSLHIAQGNRVQFLEANTHTDQWGSKCTYSSSSVKFVLKS